MENKQQTKDMSKKPVFKIINYPNVLQIKTRKGFSYRLFFLLSAPIIWLIKGEINLK